MKKKHFDDGLLQRAYDLSLWGLIDHWDEAKGQKWLPQLLDWEEVERSQRSLDRRLKSSRIKRFKPLADFDWDWPSKIDQALIQELCSFGFMEDKANVVLVGPNGIGKTMIAKNLAHQAVLRGHTVSFISAAEMLGDLVAQDSASGLQRRLKRYVRPQLLVVDEVGYLSYDNRHADLLFEVVTRRYNERSTIITTNKAFKEWNEVFPNAACVVALIDRLVHNSEIVEIKGKSYRLKEAEEKQAKKAKARAAKPKRKRAKR